MLSQAARFAPAAPRRSRQAQGVAGRLRDLLTPFATPADVGAAVRLLEAFLGGAAAAHLPTLRRRADALLAELGGAPLPHAAAAPLHAEPPEPAGNLDLLCRAIHQHWHRATALADWQAAQGDALQVPPPPQWPAAAPGATLPAPRAPRPAAPPPTVALSVDGTWVAAGQPGAPPLALTGVPAPLLAQVGGALLPSFLQRLAPLVRQLPRGGALLQALLQAAPARRAPLQEACEAVLRAPNLPLEAAAALLDALVSLRSATLPLFVQVMLAVFAQPGAPAPAPGIGMVLQLSAVRLRRLLQAHAEPARVAYLAASLTAVLQRAAAATPTRQAALLQALGMLHERSATAEWAALGQVVAQLDKTPERAWDTLLNAAHQALPSELGLGEVAKLLGALAALPSHDPSRLAHTLAALPTFEWPTATLCRLARALGTVPSDEWDRLLRQLLPRDDAGAPEAGFALVSALASLGSRSWLQRHTLSRLIPQEHDTPAELLDSASLLEALEALGTSALAVLGATPNWRAHLDVRHLCDTLHPMRPASRLHTLHCLRRLLNPHRWHSWPFERRLTKHVVRAVAEAPQMRAREVAVRHWQALQLDVFDLSGWGEADLDDFIRLPAPRRAALLHALRDLNPGAGFAWSDAWSVLSGVQTCDLDHFVRACRVDRLGRWQLVRPRLSDIVAVRRAYDAGYLERFAPAAAIPDAGRDVHETTLTQACQRTVRRLQALLPEAPPVAATLCTVRDTLQAWAAALPPGARARQRDPHTGRSPVEDALHALDGHEPHGYGSFTQDAGEAFALGDGSAVRLGTLAALVWGAIEIYPEGAVHPGLTPAEVARDRALLQQAYYSQLAACVENGARVCYAGKATRIVQALQGFVAGVSLDGVDGDAYLSPSTQLTLLAERFAATYDDADLVDHAAVTAFAAEAMVLAEQRWLGTALLQFEAQLNSYLAMTFDPAGD